MSVWLQSAAMRKKRAVICLHANGGQQLCERQGRSPDAKTVCQDWPGEGSGEIWSAKAAAPAAAGVAPGVTLTRGLMAGTVGGRPLALVRTRRLPAPAAAAAVTAASAAERKISCATEGGSCRWTYYLDTCIAKSAVQTCVQQPPKHSQCR